MLVLRVVPHRELAAMATGAGVAADERGDGLASDAALMQPAGPNLVSQPACQHDDRGKQDANKDSSFR
jgi:hypothetical protein